MSVMQEMAVRAALGVIKADRNARDYASRLDASGRGSGDGASTGPRRRAHQFVMLVFREVRHGN